MDYILETNKLTKTYKHQTVLSQVSIHVEQGSVYGLLGPNGAGKSTLLKSIMGVISVDSGSILYKGRDWNKEDLREMSAVIENPAIYPNLTAYENLKVVTTLLDIDEKRINEVLKTVGLTNTGNKIAKNFSLGMKQRLGIAVALINSPKLLILDEPTNGLDPLGIQELRELIRSFAKEGITVILSSHILTEVQQVADTIGIINNGHLSYEGKNEQHGEDIEKLFIDIIKKEGGFHD